MRTLITGGTIVNEGTTFDGSIVIENGNILDIYQGTDGHSVAPVDETIDASGCFVLPGIIDSHVHFREPGLTDKADIGSESRAAAAGGVTSFFDMPNTVPQTTTLETLAEKHQLAAQKSRVNYAFFFGATNNNASLFRQLDPQRVPGIKLFMGSSTGNMLVDRRESLECVFQTAAELHLPLMAHCEDTAIINRNLRLAQERYGEDPRVIHHPAIRSEEACYESTRLAVELAQRFGTRLHVAHVSTEKELLFFDPSPSAIAGAAKKPQASSSKLQRLTAEATVSHLYFSERDYALLGTRIKCNPAIKTERDRDALQQALVDGRISTVATDHAPHLLSQKEGGCVRAASGMPMIQFSLVTMLELVDKGVLTLERLVELMCHTPARLFGVVGRGFLRPGFRADLVLVSPHRAWTVTRNCIESKCGWSPMEGHTYLWQVQRTLCNGHTVYRKGVVDDDYQGEQICFCHED